MRQRSRLIKDNGLYVFHQLQRLRIADEDALLGAHAAAHHQSRRRSQTQRTGTGDHQSGDGSHQRRSQAGGEIVWVFERNDAQEGDTDALRSLRKKHPKSEGENGQGDHDGHKDGSDFIRQKLHRNLGVLCILNQPDHLCQEGIIAHLLRFYLQIAIHVECGAQDAFSSGASYGHGFTRNHGLVYICLAFDYHGIRGNLHPRFHDQDVARLHLADGNFLFCAIFPENGGFGAQIHQFADGLRSLAAGLTLQIPARVMDGQDHRCDAVKGMRINVFDKERKRPNQERSECAHGDQHVHIGRAGLKRSKGRTIHAPRRENHDVERE